ncbi:MAG: fused MFS/spermidine synthase [Planctomycetota bacterium]
MATDSTSDSLQLTVPAVGTRHAVLASTVFAITVFGSAFLLFLVQPLLGKYILPWFGGSPSVWTTCMLIFQALLFFGYAYAHLLSRLPLRWQATLHAGMLVAAVCTLPITPDSRWKPTEISDPASQIILLVLACVGLPYFLLSATGPLLQSWFARTQPGISPYRLYALSNIGSLLALLAYPFVFERWLAKPDQTVAWSCAFALFAILCSVCAALVCWQVGAAGKIVRTELDAGISQSSPPTAGLVLLWFALSMVASMFLLASTNQICLDVAVIPFLWVIPLALYLLTFIICFDGDHWYQRRVFLTISVLTMPIACFYTLLPASGSLVFQLGIYFTALFAGCMVCHGELVHLKPSPKYLTLFYLTISAGGSCGGLFVGLLAPAIFVDYYEFHVAVLGFVLLAVIVVLRSRLTAPQFQRVGMAALVLWCLAIVGFSVGARQTSKYMAMSRNFYGNLKVEREISRGQTRSPRLLIHGRIVHGAQNVASPTRRMEPTTYYGRKSGVGLAFAHINQKPGRHVGVIGLGIGTIATYGRTGDRFRFYEINPAVVDFARSYFLFLAKCPAENECVIGDARLVLEREEPQAFDLIVLDAFSGDAIPVHLLTAEAFEVYLRHLAPGGLLACHVSNVHFDLLPVLAGIADDQGLSAIQIDSEGNPAEFQTDATWVILSRDANELATFTGGKNFESVRRTFWTDDQNNLFDVLTR